MKKLISMIIVLALVLTFTIPAFAVDTATTDPVLLYNEYIQIIDEANKTYDLDLTLLPYDQIDSFCSAEEFSTIVSNYCQLRTVEFSAGLQSSMGSMGARGVGVVTVPNVKTKSYAEDTITITFYGTFDVRKNLNGLYYAASKSFTVYTQSSQGIIAFVISGDPTTSLMDGGRTTVVTQNFNVVIRGYFSDYASVSAQYYLSPTYGTVSALTY